MNNVVFVRQCAVGGCYTRTKKGAQMCEHHQKMYEEGNRFKAFYGKTVQKKFVPRFKDLKFQNDKQFRSWLKKTTRYEIEFQGEQDLVRMYVDALGEVLYCEHGSHFYIGRFIDVDFHLVSEGRSFKAHQPLRMWEEERKSFQSLYGLIIKEVKTNHPRNLAEIEGTVVFIESK